MRDLTAVRLIGGGTLLVLADGRGVEYAVPIASLRQTLGQALGHTETPPASTASQAGTQAATQERTPAPVRKEPTMESSLRPRDIQTRIRAGESPEDVAAVAGSSLDKVMIYASPVLAERAHVAEGALRASLRRRSPATTSSGAELPRTLGAAAAQRLRDQGVDPESVAWDAWRREDGRWTLAAAYLHEGEARTAHFTFDAPGNFVTADDAESRWLVGEEERQAPAPIEVPAQGLRLAPAPAAGEDTVDLTRSETADADWMALSDPVPTQRRAAEPAEEPMLFDQEAPEQAEDEDEDEQDRADALQSPRRAPRKSRGRAQVPSWDEIMFGTGSGD